jgi:hypothetical protein
VYDLVPEGAVLGLHARLNIKYDVADLPVGLAETMLRIAAWDDKAGVWTIVDDSVVDTQKHEVSAQVARFATYAVFAPIRPASLTVRDLAISPAEIVSGSSASISILVTNDGELPGTMQIALRLDGVLNTTKDVRLDGGATEKAVFTVSDIVPGTHSVDVAGLSGTLTVLESAAPPPPAPRPVNWGLMMGIIGGAIAATAMIAMLVFMALSRRITGKGG